MRGDPFDVSQLARTSVGRASLRTLRPLIDRALGFDVLSRLYRGLPSSRCARFEASALETLGIRIDVSPEALAHLPARGPLIVVANHPHGVADGLVLATLVARVRRDAKIVANRVLDAVPELAESCFFVDPFGGARATTRSRAGLRAAHLWLREGGALILFPAGEVAHARDERGILRDEGWQPTIGRLAATTGAAVVPAYIAGENSRLFYRAGRIHPLLRTALLGRELLRQRDTTIQVRVGAAIASIPPAVSEDPAVSGHSIVAAARRAVDDLARGSVLEAPSADAIADELARLAPEAGLVASGGFRVFCAEASALPRTLQELGRLREITFRAVGEGTGRRVDVDEFDARYLHLVCWDEQARRVVGAYRMGRTDHIVAAYGVEGLYTRTLFTYQQVLIDRLGPALELGRSFVRHEYQRNHSALLLLWLGIGRYVSRHPQYRVLFGPVSISARYSDASHELLMAFLEHNHRHEALAELVQAVTPWPTRPAPAPGPPVVPRTSEEASRLVAALEPDGKGMPVLLKQYLKLNARVLAFNVDPSFGNALDALMMVDLATVDRAILNRYMGREHAEQFLQQTGAVQAA